MNTCFRLGLSASVLIFAGTASAHVRLLDPPDRYAPPAEEEDHQHIKEAPCGVTGDSRGAEDPSRVTTYAPGETITVSWNETIDHPGHYRIAIDLDGQDDFADPPNITDDQTGIGPVLLDMIDNPPGGGLGSAMVTLPNQTCTNCTLQLIELMTDKAPYALTGPDADDVYHQCADIIIEGTPVASGGTGQGGSATTGGTGSGGTGGGFMGVDPIGGTTSTGGTGGTGTTSGGTTGTTTSNHSSSKDDGGCAVSGRRGTSQAGLLIGFAALALAGLRRRR